MSRACPTCGHPLGETSPIDAELIALKTACELLGIAISWDSHVAEADAAKLLGLSRKTLSNRRSLDHPIPFRKRLGRIEYQLEDLARWRAESIKKSPC